jgi:c(7)-type cytochrome triheme protein
LKAALVMLVLAVAGLVVAAPRQTAIGFDHHAHDGKLDVAAKTPPPCVQCHQLDKSGRLVGRPSHDSCFGACHGTPPARPKSGGKIVVGDREKVCEACHAEATLLAPFTGKLRAQYPPYTLDRDFNLGFGHKQHASAACGDCHAFDKKDVKTPFVPHERCATCHAKKMDQCGGCHPPASGKPQPPELMAVHDTVTSAFSHSAHAARGAKGKDCVTCHATVRTTDDTELPRPKVEDCGSGGCHDGKAAFATTAACTRCHDRAPEERYTVYRPQQRFSHGGSHAAVIASQPCSSCHVISGNEVVVAGHAACSGCHADDFGKRKPEKCGACHTATEPWRHLVADRSPAERTEIGATLDHSKHTGACVTCHVLQTASAQLRPPRGHRACTTAGCHGATGPAPHLDACDGCHRVGLAAARAATRAKDPWSVRLAFDHAPHAKDKAGALVACTECHVDLSAPDVIALPAPPKKTCARCHDGAIAFSLTGTGCTRCHASPK